MSDATMNSKSGLSRRSMFFIVLTALLFAVPLIPGIPVYWITLLDNIGLAALVAIGLILLTGVGGMTSFGQATFCGFAAYTTAVLCAYHGFSPWISLFFSVAVTLVAAVILGIKGLKVAKANPNAKGAAHAWVGIICGAIFGGVWILLDVLSLIAMAAAASHPR